MSSLGPTGTGASLCFWNAFLQQAKGKVKVFDDYSYLVFVALRGEV